MVKPREALEKALVIFDWLERRSIYQDAQVKDAHDAVRAALAEPSVEQELLEALEALVQLEADGHHASENAIEHWGRARRAIARAKGELR